MLFYSMQLLCDCSIRVTVVLEVRQPQLLSHKFMTACCAIQNLTKRGVAYV